MALVSMRSSESAPAADSASGVMARAATTAREILGMDMAFVSDTRAGVQRYVCVAGDGDSFGAQRDASLALEGTYCELLHSRARC
jgi:hypothetical protein